MSRGRGTSRRDFLRTIVISAGAIKAAPLLAGCGDDDGSGSPDAGSPDAGSPDAAAENVFAQSVVSGDPRPTSIVLWTRAARAAGGDLPVVLQVSTDAAFASMVVLSQSDFTAREEADGCLRIKVTDLSPGTRYYYRFTSGDSVSPTGRFKTAAAADSDVPVRFAVLSCQDYIGRHYNTLLELLDEAQDDLDFVVHLGDYVYETTGDPQFQQGSGRHITFDDEAGAQQLGSGAGAYFAARSLSNYRQLWRTYRSDPTLQKVHEKFPFIAIWDDHEFADDCWQDAINYSDGVAVLRDPERRLNAEQAFFENQPVALDSETGEGALSIDRDDLFPNTRLYRDFRFGQHVHLLMTDYRSFRPDHPVAEDGFPGTVVMTAADVAATPGGPDLPVELLAPYVDIDGKAFAAYKGALEAILPAAYVAAGADEERAAALTAAAARGNVDAKVINRLILRIPEETRPPAIPLEGLDAGISLAAMGKSGLFGQLGARYLSIKPTYDLYAAFRTASGSGDDPYGAAQAGWIAERLDAEADATWKLFGNSTALTSLIVDLEPFAEQIGDLLPATQLYLDVDQWDGFPAAREALLLQLRSRNAVILSGDIHAAYFSDYGGDKVGNRVVEFTGPGVSSGPFAELLQSTAESIPELSGNPLVGVLIGAIDSLLPAGFGPVKFSNSKVNGVMVFTASGTELIGRYAMLAGAEALTDQTGGTVEFQRKQIVIPKVDGKNGEPTIS